MSTCAAVRCPRFRPSRVASENSTVNWAVKAFVDATPISGPARVGKTKSASRAIVLSGTFTMPTDFKPNLEACRIAMSVSRLSPDCEMARAAAPFPCAGCR